MLARRSLARHAQGAASVEQKRRRHAPRPRRADAEELQPRAPGVLAHANAAGIPAKPPERHHQNVAPDPTGFLVVFEIVVSDGRVVVGDARVVASRRRPTRRRRRSGRDVGGDGEELRDAAGRERDAHGIRVEGYFEACTVKNGRQGL